MDELNKYASKDTPKNSPILKEILDVTDAEDLGNVLELNSLEVTFMTELLVNCATVTYVDHAVERIIRGKDDMLITLLKVC